MLFHLCNREGPWGKLLFLESKKPVHLRLTNTMIGILRDFFLAGGKKCQSILCNAHRSGTETRVLFMQAHAEAISELAIIWTITAGTSSIKSRSRSGLTQPRAQGKD